MNPIENARHHSQYLSRHLDNGNLQPDILNPMLEKTLGSEDFQAFADWGQIQADENEAELARQLRRLRRYVMAQIIVCDINRISNLSEVTRTITLFADFAVNTVLDFAHAYYRDMYGTPIGRYSNEPQFLSVVAMGKAGGYELNVSSDLDLIFIYPESGDTDGKRERSNQEFFTKVGQKLITLLNDITEDGQVFRIDMRLRPDGDSGALVLSETALEQYLIQQGREWERYAWCKGRVVTPHANSIRALVRPFVFRKYLDFNAYEGMRGLHRQIRSEVNRKGMADNVKLGAGGIREIEFIAQIFQLIRGGQVRALQLKGTQETLLKLAELNMLDRQTVQMLLEAYRFLRDVEHRLQYWDDQQTQTLPDNPEQQQRLAESMGFADYAAFSDGLDRYRRQVNAVFNEILAEPDEQPQAQANGWQCIWQQNADEETRSGRLVEHGFDAVLIGRRLDQIRNSGKYRHLSAQAQPRFDAVIPLLAQAAATQPDPTVTLLRLLDFLENISRRSSYLAFLHEHPQALQRLADIMGQSSWVSGYLMKHPILLDELLSAQLMDTGYNWPKLAAELSDGLRNAAGDTEAQMDVLRRFQHAQVFRLAVQDLAGLWTVEALSDQLSALADTILAAAMPAVWADTPKTHTDTPQIGIIGYGKLGGKELGYTSDLDLVYVYDDPHPDAPDVYARFARRLTNWLSAATGAGTLYEVDLRLRPNGDSGFLTHSIAAFEKYQRENAWTWEHQSLTRARFICGKPEIDTAFDTLRTEILTRPRNRAELAREIIAMREKMFPTHPPEDNDVKYARGGVVDVEFIVQYLILAYAGEHPQLLDNYGNIALLNIAADAGLIDKTLAEQSRTAYRFYRQQQHNTKLRDADKPEINGQIRSYYDSVRKLWEQVFGEEVRFEAV
ncbi:MULTISPECIES: bifunctional [glutamate--ammonia ligase]-adenylyl-L-tyrosine phosphorylase/[glutamate--ammonia-ligase] adenylyltransferase [unclassified Neisseria]|uniref:bifunctional [glutamate--ammonia ligase]-adenylyl-L-tyrosine phosphorylase/[glutamate--ammonia-ligase] adenylyltransferase n=1 Tax=unclassified Neisseria TaxID=2623750 RepID=UPI00266591AD|nr:MULTISPECIES: bifunctional [glutamate--ammonia ligase]-adenylyl-L-tyrosine phosphorylase/[glutamate--ammonia-ligase] adenylyltransferase [unclassified Neisseria]MDO1510861.1 bifunctional [glutamate--ammonia ligase]-adenylyl-L-tyrosine phosphorylase/[glutamate--ammonia-ligase] adenylyltransferase [Neisseria sp. MVDL19-042950]MDO1517137.1 bifunctional [glutamate--ammonia ligase]-adenylyl-L-tyrosine phosphorylase/[glutamate--ammonia-ligase] adenylyltransferase [Neisseria sp. MVDL18-041461]MDO156